MASAAKEYIGLWINQDKNGKDYLSGKNETTRFFIFKNEDGSRSLKTRPIVAEEGIKFTTVGNLIQSQTSEGKEFFKIGDMCVFPNERREKETHPHFNLVVYEAQA